MKRLTFPLGSINVNQLHGELLAAFHAWKGTPQADGSFKDPLLSVEHSATEIRLGVPDTSDDVALNAVIAAHVPKPAVNPTETIRVEIKTKLAGLGLSAAALKFLVRET